MARKVAPLLYATIALSLISAFWPPLLGLLGLSWAGLKHFFFWQLLTYPFVSQGPFTLLFALDLGFKIYLLWFFGTALSQRASVKTFYYLYFGAALAGAVAALPFPNLFLASCTIPLFAIMAAWTMLHPHAQMLLFFAIPTRASTLIAVLLGILLFIDIAAGLFAHAAGLAAGTLFGYLFAVIVWKESGLFPRFERFILRLFEKRPPKLYNPTKIYDFQSGKPVLNDDEFMDAMLDKMSRLGPGSITEEEQIRMQQISKRKKP